MAGRRTNLGLLVLLAVALATGGLAYALGTSWGRWAVVAHGVAGAGIVVLAPWKSAVVRRGVRHHGTGSAPSALLGVLLVLTIVTGVVHAAGVREMFDLGVTAMQVHVGAALAAVPFAGWHVVARPVRPRRADLSRRAALRTAAAGAGAVGLYVAVEGAFRLASVRGTDRRFTGSHEVGSFDPPAMPVTQWFDDSVPRIDAEGWRLVVRDGAGERTLRYGDLRGGRDRVTAVLDCTGGWYATQRWEGVRLDRLLGDTDGSRSIVVGSATGYQRRFPVGDAADLVLAVRAGGQPLSAGHGFPARLVAPGRRGFWWVKWVDRVETDAAPWWWQPPFPLT